MFPTLVRLLARVINLFLIILTGNIIGSVLSADVFSR